MISGDKSMNLELIEQIHLLNPWLKDPSIPIMARDRYLPRRQEPRLLSKSWDTLWTILVGPRQAGKTTMGLHLSQRLIEDQRFETLLYLNCDLFDIRQWLSTPLFVTELLKHFKLRKPILFIDEVQRLENPGLLLKAIVDLRLPIKLIASGSSQLEIKSKVQESLTGRQFESVVLPFSFTELQSPKSQFEDFLTHGAYPSVWRNEEKQLLLAQLYKDYINKDIVEHLRIGKTDAMQKLLILIAHASGQLVNYQQLSNDCLISSPTVQNYLAILEQTFVLEKLTPFIGNKRQEITSNPVYYFIDNGFRNQSLRNFLALDKRSDLGLLVEGFILQEILKFRAQNYLDFNIHYWRTKSGAEVDFVLYKDPTQPLAIEVKYRNMQTPQLTRAFRSFIEAYKPNDAVVMTKSYLKQEKIENCWVHFIPVVETHLLEERILNLLE
jgi:predicted AAA+ superfamily ATPase